MSEVVQHTEVGAVEGVKAPPGGCIFPGTEAKVPFSNHVGGVAGLLQQGRQHGEACGYSTRPQRLQGPVLSAQVVRVPGGIFYDLVVVTCGLVGLRV